MRNSGAGGSERGGYLKSWVIFLLFLIACSAAQTSSPSTSVPLATPAPAPASTLNLPSTVPSPQATPTIVLETLVPTPSLAPKPSPTSIASEPSDRDRMGYWVSVPNVPVAAWSAALLPTGRVVLFQNGSSMYLFNPKTRQFSARFSSHTNTFCAGLALLADGRLIAVGGHQGKDEVERFLGVKSAEVFDPWQREWTRLPDMAGGERWYPTAITLADGRVLVASGTHGGKMNEAMELFDPQQNEWKIVARKRLPIYPWAAVMPQGDILFYGPQRQAEYFDPASGTFRPGALRQLDRSEGAGVLLNARTGDVLALGGGKPSTASANLFDNLENRWGYAASMKYPRGHPNAVLLPDGRVLAVGGHAGNSETDKEEEKGAKEGDPMPAEVYDPEQWAWLEVAKTHYGHGYHSVALLLPDGSVLAAGPQRNLEIYFPWYFSRQRPVIGDVPKEVRYKQEFLVKTSDAAGIAKVVAIRLSSVTHSLNTDQRYVETEFTPTPDGLLVKAPPQPSIAPPGYYLLFIAKGDKVPSEGRFFQLR